MGLLSWLFGPKLKLELMTVEYTLGVTPEGKDEPQVLVKMNIPHNYGDPDKIVVSAQVDIAGLPRLTEQRGVAVLDERGLVFQAVCPIPLHAVGVPSSNVRTVDELEKRFNENQRATVTVVMSTIPMTKGCRVLRQTFRNVSVSRHQPFAYVYTEQDENDEG